MKLQELNETLSEIAGTEVEITVIGERKFSIIWEGENAKAEAAIKEYFGANVTWDEDEVYDEECDTSAIYMNA